VVLPRLLAGPILRRVETTLMAVWVATSEPAVLRLSVWEGRVTAGAANPFLTGPQVGVPTVRVGNNLFVGLVSLRIPVTSAQGFQPDTVYSYDVDFKFEGDEENLASLGMLSAETVDGIAHVPLGYEPGMLPGFAPPPSSLDDLRVVYGSCRKPNYEGPDAMVFIDDYVFAEDRYKDPRRRPHQLLLGGDQIYADDVSGLHMLTLMELGQELIGRTGGASVTPLEQVDVDSIVHRTGTPDPAEPSRSYTGSTPPQAGRLPADRAHFPEDHRLVLSQKAAQLTSTDGDSHLISVGEFAAAYLTAWSNAPWGAEIPGVQIFPKPDQPTMSHALTWAEEVRPEARIETPTLEFPSELPEHLAIDPPNPEGDTPAEQRENAEKAEQHRQRRLREIHKCHQDFLAGLPKVRRALANIPTYMILDDHDVTDDFFLNPIWRKRVVGTSLGQTILRNAMLSYAVFQDWGNHPVRYDDGLRAELLQRVTELFPSPVEPGPMQAPAARLGVLFGHDQHNAVAADGRYSPVRPPITWHFTVDGPTHRVVALDNRTRRSYVSNVGPPGNVSIDAQEEQIPRLPLLAGQQVLVVIAPLQVVGPPVLDDVVSPLTFRFFDVLAGQADLQADSGKGKSLMPATDPDAIESWAFDAVTFEHLLLRLQEYQRVVLLSGDVHNSSGSLMSYWRKDALRPARIAQFTSSGFKNVMPIRITAVDRSLGFAQQMIRAKLGIERLGWDRPDDDLVILPTGLGALDLTPGIRASLRSTPVTLPTWGWPDENGPSEPFDPAKLSRLNPSRPPDWRWRIMPLLDERSDFDPEHPDPQARPAPISPLPLDNHAIDQALEDFDDHEAMLKAYAAIGARHQRSLDHLRNARQILFRSNFGLLRFASHADGRLDAVHEVYTAFADPDHATTEPPEVLSYLFQVAALGPEDEERPEHLRERVIERRAVGGGGGP
jgi:hypothetical protein